MRCINYSIFCLFVTEKARLIESYGAIGGLVMDNVEGSTASQSPIFSMSGDGNDDVSIPMLFIFKEDSK